MAEYEAGYEVMGELGKGGFAERYLWARGDVGVVGWRWYQHVSAKFETARSRLYRSQLLQVNSANKYSLELAICSKRRLRKGT